MPDPGCVDGGAHCQPQNKPSGLSARTGQDLISAEIEEAERQLSISLKSEGRMRTRQQSLSEARPWGWAAGLKGCWGPGPRRAPHTELTEQLTPLSSRADTLYRLTQVSRALSIHLSTVVAAEKSNLKPGQQTSVREPFFRGLSCGCHMSLLGTANLKKRELT
jgi:hypothetical protein